jgi:hypothetical protein
MNGATGSATAKPTERVGWNSGVVAAETTDQEHEDASRFDLAPEKCEGRFRRRLSPVVGKIGG